MSGGAGTPLQPPPTPLPRPLILGPTKTWAREERYLGHGCAFSNHTVAADLSSDRRTRLNSFLCDTYTTGAEAHIAKDTGYDDPQFTVIPLRMLRR